MAQLRRSGTASQSHHPRLGTILPLQELYEGVWPPPEMGAPAPARLALAEIRPDVGQTYVLHGRATPRTVSTMAPAQNCRMDPIAERLNDLGEQDAGN